MMRDLREVLVERTLARAAQARRRRELKLSRNLSSARTVRDITRKEFDVPTTIARSGGRNYVVTAKFSTPAIPTTPYEVVKVPRR